MNKIWALLRLSLGWILLWAFLDKMWGLGFATKAGSGWLDGVSPTTGFLTGTSGQFASIYQGLAGQVWVDWLYMAGLGLMGAALILGVGIRIAAYAGVLFMLLLFTAVFPPRTNPFLDQHIVYILVLLGIAKSEAGKTWGLGNWWGRSALVKRFPFLL